MNKRKRIKLKISDNLSKKYFNKDFRDLEEWERIEFFKFAEFLIYESQRYAKKSLNKIEEELK